MGASKQIKLGAVLSYISIAVNIIAGLLYTPWMVAQIGEGDYGLYTLANSLITLFLVDFGLSAATSRYISKYRAEGRQDKIDSFLGAIYKLYLIIDAVIFVVLFVVYFFIDKIYVQLTPTEMEKFRVIYIMAASFAVVNFPFVTFNGILNAYEKFIQLKLADVIYRILLVGITVVALIMGYGLYALVAVHALVGLIIIAYKWVIIKKTLPIKVNIKSTERSLYKDIFSFSIWVAVATLAQRLVFNITPSILGIVASSTAIAIFGIVATIEGYTYTISSAINGMFMPKISRIYQGEDAQRNMMPLMLGVGRFQYALNGLIVAGFAVVGKSFIELWLGSLYVPAYYGIMLVIVPGLFYNALEIANTAMVVQKKVNLQAYVNIGMGLLNVALSFVLSYKFGVVGACVSIFVAYTFRTIALIVIYHRVMKFDIITFVKKCYIRMSIPIVLTVFIGFGMNYFVPNGGWLIFIAKGAVTVAIYMALTLLLGFNKEEKSNIINMVKSKIKK
ncbi:MAG: polysaccharide biosynthesis protein [Clostridia bacterium]|nr:polysaccharide biosynthesis protein [Clostridia bacterium]